MYVVKHINKLFSYYIYLYFYDMEIQKLIQDANLSDEKKKEIYQAIRDAAMAVNNVECAFHGTGLEHKLLNTDTEQPTIWTQLFTLEKLFNA